MFLFKRKIVIVLYLTSMQFTFGQQIDPKVNLYSINSTFQKLKTKYPFVEIVECPTSKNIKVSKDVVYRGKLLLDAYFPINKTLKTPILMVHGGGWQSGSKENYKDYAYQLALQGYKVFTINYTLSDTKTYPQPLIDIKNSIEWIRENYNLKGEKFILVGDSSGGQLVSLFGNKYSSDTKAIINIDGLLSFTHPDAEETDSAIKFLGGPIETNYNNWKEASALNYIHSKSPPTLIFKGNHKRFTAGIDDYKEQYKKLNLSIKIIDFKDAPHSFWLLQPWFDETFYHILKYLIDLKIN